jgi:hypothetical protein
MALIANDENRLEGLILAVGYSVDDWGQLNFKKHYFRRVSNY